MKDEILKTLFSFSPKFFKELFDKYMEDEDYDPELSIIGSSQTLLDELLTDYGGAIYYLQDMQDIEELRTEKLPFFDKFIKYVDKYNRIPSHMRLDEKGELVLKINENEQDLPKENTENAVVEYESVEEKKKKSFLFDSKINVLNHCRLFYYCSNIFQSLPPLKYFSVLKIYFQNYALKVLVACSLFCTFITYIYEKQHLEGIFYLLLFLFYVFVDKLHQFICYLEVYFSDTCTDDKNE